MADDSNPINWQPCAHPNGVPGRSYRWRASVDGQSLWKNKTTVGRWVADGRVWMSVRPKKGTTLDDAARLLAVKNGKGLWPPKFKEASGDGP